MRNENNASRKTPGVGLTGRAAATLTAGILAVSSCLSSLPAKAVNYVGRGTKRETTYLVHMSDKFGKVTVKGKKTSAKAPASKQKRPWVLAFGNDGNNTDVVNALQKACDANGWLLVASGNNKSNLSIKQLEPIVLDTIYSAKRTLPVDPANMYVYGAGSGTTVAHWLTEKYPGSVRGVIVNQGTMDAELLRKLSYPNGKGKCAVFLTNTQDSHYKDMRKDCQLLRSAGWTTRWAEVPSGHEPEYMANSLKWLVIEAKVLPKPPVALPPESIASIQKKVAAAEASQARDYNKLSRLNEQLGDAYLDNKKAAEAEAAYKAALAAKQSGSPDSMEVADLEKKLGDHCVTHERYTEAAEFLEKAIAIYEKGTDQSKLSKALESYANILFICGKDKEAAGIYDRLNAMKDASAKAKKGK